MYAHRMISLVVLGVMLSVMVTACGRSAAPAVETTGCRLDIRGVAGLIQVETSKLSCDSINRLISAIPSEPQAYSIVGESPHLLWNCRLYAAKGHTDLLRCAHNAERFTIKKVGG